MKKRKNKSKPVQRSLKCLSENGFTCSIVEKWIPPRGKMKFGVRIDVWGFGDLLAMRPKMLGKDGKTVHEPVIALVQCCRDADLAEHRAKIEAIPEFYLWKLCGGRVFLQGWGFKGARGEKKHWTMREEEL